MGLAFILVFIAPPLLLALLAGMVFPRRWIIAGVGSVLALAFLLMATSGYGFVEMAPFTGIVGAMVVIPAVIAAFLGARIKSWLAKES